MTTMAIESATATKRMIETIFEKMGLEERIEEFLELMDEMKLDRELELSWLECERGECSDLEEAVARIRREVHER